MEYTSYDAWFAAASLQPGVVVMKESFANNTLNTPGLSVSTRSGMGNVVAAGNGQIANAEWIDCVGKTACNGNLYDSTTFSFDKPLYAFGGFWELPAPSLGGLEIYTGLSPYAISPNEQESGRYATGSAFTGFFGFVSDTPFASVILTNSYGSQSFTLSDPVFGVDPPAAEAPEPAFLAPFGAAALFLMRSRRQAWS